MAHLTNSERGDIVILVIVLERGRDDDSDRGCDVDNVVDQGAVWLSQSPLHIQLPVRVLDPSPRDGRIRIADANHWIIIEVIHGGTAMAEMIAEAINAEAP